MFFYMLNFRSLYPNFCYNLVRAATEELRLSIPNFFVYLAALIKFEDAWAAVDTRGKFLPSSYLSSG